MAISYPQDVKSSSDLVKGDFAADQYRGASRLQGLIDLGVLAIGAPIQIPSFNGATVTATSWTAVDTGTILVPHLVEAGIADRILIIVQANMAAGSQQGYLRISLTGQSPGAADEVSVTETSATDKTVESPAVSAEDFDALSVTTVTLEGKVDSGHSMTVATYRAAIWWGAN